MPESLIDRNVRLSRRCGELRAQLDQATAANTLDPAVVASALQCAAAALTYAVAAVDAALASVQPAPATTEPPTLWETP